MREKKHNKNIEMRPAWPILGTASHYYVSLNHLTFRGDPSASLFCSPSWYIEMAGPSDQEDPKARCERMLDHILDMTLNSWLASKKKNATIRLSMRSQLINSDRTPEKFGTKLWVCQFVATLTEAQYFAVIQWILKNYRNNNQLFSLRGAFCQCDGLEVFDS